MSTAQTHSPQTKGDPTWQYMQGDRFGHANKIELVEVSPGNAKTKMHLQPQHLNGVGIVHGGAVFTLADIAFAAASNSYGTVALAINVSINFMKAVSTGTLWAEAREVTKNHKLGTYVVEVKDEQGEMVALFQGMVYRKKDKLPVQLPGSPH